MQYWYLASPYTSHLKGEGAKAHEEEERYKAIIDTVHVLMQGDLTVFSPILHYHPVRMAYDLPGHHSFWMNLNEAFIKNSCGIIVAQLPGWDDSVGIADEIQFAKSLKLPVLYHQP